MMSDFRVGRGVQNSVIYGRSQIDFVVLRKTRPLSVQEKTNQILALMEKDRNSCISCRLMASLHTFLHTFFSITELFSYLCKGFCVCISGSSGPHYGKLVFNTLLLVTTYYVVVSKSLLQYCARSHMTEQR